MPIEMRASRSRPSQSARAVITAGCDEPTAAALLIRPDSYVAWAVAQEADHRQREGLRSALST